MHLEQLEGRTLLSSILVGESRPIDTIKEAISVAKDGDTILVDGDKFSIPSTINVSKDVTIKAANPNDKPVFEYSGKRETSIFFISGNADVSLDNVNCKVAKGAFVLGAGGSVESDNVSVSGGGSAVRAVGAVSVVCNNWIVTQASDNYVFYVGGITTQNSSSAYAQRSTGNFELNNCVAVNGVSREHVVRIHNTNRVRIINCKFVQPSSKSYSAVLRVHDSGDVQIKNSTFVGSVCFGPLDGGDGGINLPAGPKKTYLSKLRLAKLVVENTNFDTKDFKITAGVLSGLFSNCKITDMNGASVIDTPWPYTGRPKSVITFDNVDFIHADGTGRVFSDPEGSSEMIVRNGSTFNRNSLVVT